MFLDSDAWVEQIWDQWNDPKSGADHARLTAKIDEALASHPNSVDLLLQRGMAECRRDDADIGLAKGCFDQAIALAPNDGEVLCELGYWYDVYQDDPRAALPYFCQSIRNDGYVDAWCGLARVLLELGRRRTADRVIRSAEARWPGHKMVVDIRGDYDANAWAPIQT